MNESSSNTSGLASSNYNCTMETTVSYEPYHVIYPTADVHVVKHESSIACL
jgi:hypothetical protein